MTAKEFDSNGRKLDKLWKKWYYLSVVKGETCNE